MDQKQYSELYKEQFQRPETSNGGGSVAPAPAQSNQYFPPTPSLHSGGGSVSPAPAQSVVSSPKAPTSKATVVLLVLFILSQAFQGWRESERAKRVEEFVRENDREYQSAVFDSPETKGIMQQVFRQNEANRALMKALLGLDQR